MSHNLFLIVTIEQCFQSRNQVNELIVGMESRPIDGFYLHCNFDILGHEYSNGQSFAFMHHY
jgi:hypothetical protein